MLSDVLQGRTRRRRAAAGIALLFAVVLTNAAASADIVINVQGRPVTVNVPPGYDPGMPTPVVIGLEAIAIPHRKTWVAREREVRFRASTGKEHGAPPVGHSPDPATVGAEPHLCVQEDPLGHPADSSPGERNCLRRGSLA